MSRDRLSNLLRHFDGSKADSTSAATLLFAFANNRNSLQCSSSHAVYSLAALPEQIRASSN